MIRRFVNLVAENHKTGLYSLHRLDVSKHLFHPSRADARVAPLLAGAQGNGDEQPMIDWLKDLPPPCVKIHPFFREEEVDKLTFWGLLSPRSSEDRFLCMNRMGDTLLCHADRRSVDPMPPLRDDVGLRPISFSVVRSDAQEQEEDLYVIHKVPQRGGNTSCFRVFRKDADGWSWESLPPPPFIGGPRYDFTSFMCSYTVVDGGRTICFSCATPGIGTYCFNTVEREWKHAGDWVLPFVGGAEYVPDLAFWLGFSPSYYLCGTNLNAMPMDHAPVLQFVWQDLLVAPENWSAGRTRLVNLGSGRFCIAKSFVIRESGLEWWGLEDEVTVLTGIEVGWDDAERIQVWKHKSIQYNSMYSVKGVL